MLTHSDSLLVEHYLRARSRSSLVSISPETICGNELPTFVAVLQPKVCEATTKGRALLYRSNTIIGSLVVEDSFFQQDAVVVKIASDVNVIAVLWGNVGIDDVSESGGIWIVGRRCLASFGVL